MNKIKPIDLDYIIPASMFEKCMIDGKTKQEIRKKYPKRKDGPYYLDKFINYLKDVHKITIQKYCIEYLNIDWGKSPKTNKFLGFKVSGKGIILSKYAVGEVNKENCKSFRDFCERLSKDRIGEKNPMYGKTPWNKNNKEWSQKISSMMKGRKISEETKNKQSLSAKKRKIHGHTNKKHSEESKEKMRKATIKRWENGEFSFRETEIEKKVKNYLQEIGIEFKYQFKIKKFVADFALQKENIIIECQGDFFHCNPKTKYSIPKYESQFKNLKRDKLKKELYKSLGWELIELWESDINSGEFKNILCKLKK